MTENMQVVKCLKCGKPVSWNVTFNSTNATAPPPSYRNVTQWNTTGAAQINFMADTALANHAQNTFLISTSDMCQCESEKGGT